MAMSADDRRAVLRRFMNDRGMKAAKMARIASVDKNSLYNFLNGYSASLSLETYQKLASASGVSIEALTGDRNYAPAPNAVPVVGVISGGIFRMDDDAAHEPYDIDVPVPSAYQGKAVGLEVSDASADMEYPEGSIVVWVKSSDIRPARSGDHVVVKSRNHEGGVETMVREMRVDGGEVWLSSLSRRPEFQSAIRMSRIPDELQTVEIIGVVIGCYRGRSI